MILRELFYYDKETLEPIEDDRYDPLSDDSILDIDDTRKTRLTLSQINKARKASELHIKEKQEELDFVRQMYGIAAQEAAVGVQSLVKINKHLYSKEEWHVIRNQRRRDKAAAKALKEGKPLPIKDKHIGIVLGNGTSRESIQVEQLSPHGVIYGCNALYRSFKPDYLIAVDVKMILEINKYRYQAKGEVWTNPNKAYATMKDLNYFNPSKGWSSGPTALWFASQHNYEKIYILGFDFRGLEGGKRFNNIFADTGNYKRSADGATFFGNWMRQTKTVIKEHPNIQYVRVKLPDNYEPEELNIFENYSTITIDAFKKQLNLT